MSEGHFGLLPSEKLESRHQNPSRVITTYRKKKKKERKKERKKEKKETNEY
jgi:hypothetical protein